MSLLLRRAVQVSGTFAQGDALKRLRMGFMHFADNKDVASAASSVEGLLFCAGAAGLDAEVVALGKELIDKRPSAGHAWGIGSDVDNDPSLVRTTLISLQVPQ
jgi:hypothetical protein